VKFFCSWVESVLFVFLGCLFVSVWWFMLCLVCVLMLVSVKLQHSWREVTLLPKASFHVAESDVGIESGFLQQAL